MIRTKKCLFILHVLDDQNQKMSYIYIHVYPYFFKDDFKHVSESGFESILIHTLKTGD